MVQYPLDMGRPGAKSSAVVTVDVDSTGQVRYDAILKQGQGGAGSTRNQLMQTSLADMKEKEGSRDLMALPQEDEVNSVADKTR